MAKGSQFEREICTKLSLWWSGGQSDDLFWRSATSGARATVRGRKGKSTRGHCGDICATDQTGEPFTKLFTVELKRGYNRAVPCAMLDKPLRAGTRGFEEFLHQAMDARDRAGTLYWMIIHKRDLRETVVYFPHEFLVRLDEYGTTNFPAPRLMMSFWIRRSGETQKVKIVGTTLTAFLNEVEPRDIFKMTR